MIYSTFWYNTMEYNHKGENDVIWRIFFTPHGWGITKRVSEWSHSENQSAFEQELVLQIRSNRQSHRLLLSAHPVFGRIQLTQTTFENPAQPSTFIMVLRKYLQGALIESIEQVENDRIVEINGF